MPLTFLGGVFYSIDMLPIVWQKISLINPLYWMINGLRYGLKKFCSEALSGDLLILSISIIFLSLNDSNKACKNFLISKSLNFIESSDLLKKYCR